MAEDTYRVAILGLGLIGGSLGLALRRTERKGLEVTGYARRAEVRDKAVKVGVVDRAVADPRLAVRNADIVVLATHILAVRDLMKEIADDLPDGCVVTDIASTKAEVLAWADELLPRRVNFVGGHPMAGKEQAGLTAAEPGLFEGAAYCITPSLTASEKAVRSVVAFAQLVGARPVFIDAQDHDSFVAAVSHLPLVLSAALFTLVSESQSWPDMANLAGSGFRDLTRLASGQPEMSLDICLTNREQILHWLDRFSAELERYKKLIKDGGEDLLKTFVKAQADRQKFLENPQELRPRPEGPETMSAWDSTVSMFIGSRWTERSKQLGEILRERERRAIEGLKDKQQDA